jgi:hypothetical protein
MCHIWYLRRGWYQDKEYSQYLKLCYWYVNHWYNIARTYMRLNITYSIIHSVRYHIWHISSLCLVSKRHFYGILEWFMKAVRACIILDPPVYTVFQQFHHGNLTCWAEIYSAYTQKVSMYDTIVFYDIEWVRVRLNNQEVEAQMSLMASFPYPAVIPPIPVSSEWYIQHILLF